MKQTTIKNVRESDLFTFRPYESPTERQVYVRGHYDRASKMYSYHQYSNYNREEFARASRIVYTDFDF